MASWREHSLGNFKLASQGFRVRTDGRFLCSHAYRKKPVSHTDFPTQRAIQCAVQRAIQRAIPQAILQAIQQASIHIIMPRSHSSPWSSRFESERLVAWMEENPDELRGKQVMAQASKGV